MNASTKPLAIDIDHIIDSQRLNYFVVRLVAISWLVTFCDGFDQNAIGFVAPYLKSAFALENGALGPILAAGGAGALFGGLIFGWMGDRIGRRPAIITAVGLSGIFTLLLALANRPWELLAVRFMSGIALGGALPLIWTLTIEYVPTRYRATVVTLVMLGYGLGVFAAGPLSLALIPRHGWQSVFVCGGLAALIAAVSVWRKLPESLRFRAHRERDWARKTPALSRWRELLPGRLFVGSLRWITPLLWIAFAASSMTMYFFVTWGPILFERAGLTRNTAFWSSSWNAVAGAVGAIAVMRFTDRLGPGSLVVMPLIALPLLITVALAQMGPGGFVGMIAVLHVLLGGTHYGIQSVLGAYYPTGERARGAGWAASIGKIGSVAGPMMGGWLLGSHMTSRSPFLVLALLPLVFALAIVGIARVARRGDLDGES